MPCLTFEPEARAACGRSVGRVHRAGTIAASAGRERPADSRRLARTDRRVRAGGPRTGLARPALRTANGRRATPAADLAGSTGADSGRPRHIRTGATGPGPRRSHRIRTGVGTVRRSRRRTRRCRTPVRRPVPDRSAGRGQGRWRAGRARRLRPVVARGPGRGRRHRRRGRPRMTPGGTASPFRFAVPAVLVRRWIAAGLGGAWSAGYRPIEPAASSSGSAAAAFDARGFGVTPQNADSRVSPRTVFTVPLLVALATEVTLRLPSRVVNA